MYLTMRENEEGKTELGRFYDVMKKIGRVNKKLSSRGVYLHLHSDQRKPRIFFQFLERFAEPVHREI